MSLDNLKKALKGGSHATTGAPSAKPYTALLVDDPDPVTGEVVTATFSVDLPPLGLKPNERGIVVAPPIRATDRGVRVGGVIDPQELRFSLLLWDRLRYPQNNLASVGPSPDEEFLAKAGALDYSTVRFTQGKMTERTLLATQKLGFLAQDAREPGLWSLGKGDASFSFSNTDLKPDRGILFTLHKTIPIPDQDVPLTEVLEFKLKRRDELLSLRHHLERLYQQIVASPDVDRALATELSGLDQAIAAQLKVSRESRLKLRFSDFSAKVGYRIDYKTWAVGAGAFLATPSTLPLSAAILAGVAGAAAVTFNLSGSIERTKPTATPFEYVSRFHTELFRKSG